jgi:subtilisin family serine protease
MAERKRYILLPREGFLHESLRHLAPVGGTEMSPAPFTVKSTLAGGREVLVIDSIEADGPKLVECDDLAAAEIDRHPDVLRLPVLKYRKPLGLRASYPLLAPDPVSLPRTKDPGVVIRVMETKGGNKVPADSGLWVTAFSDYEKKVGDYTTTDYSGEAILQVSGPIERLFCEKLWTWGAFRKDYPVNPINELELEPLSTNFTDCVRKYYPQSRFKPETGVSVGVIDTGVGPHDDLNVIGGRNVAEGELDHDNYQDVGPHGTFVAGLIGSTGRLFPKLRGLAPGVRIFSYRVFGEGESGVQIFSLIHAMHYAALDKCDILNLSIESPEEGPGLNHVLLQRAIIRARDKGMLVVVAAGNDNRTPVDYPAAFPHVIAVSAMGCKGTFPKGAMENMVVSDDPPGTDPNEFIASFSNVGEEINVTALGVGVLSTLPGNSFGSCSGTSFAAPVVTGAAASLLSRRPDIYILPRNRARAEKIEQLLFENCIRRGFPPTFEGHGMPDPEMV